MRIGKNWLKMSEIYKRFAEYPKADFSEAAAVEMYRHETYGDSVVSEWNGFALGKKWMDVTIAMWKEDIPKGLLAVDELRIDYPDWFLSKVGIR